LLQHNDIISLDFHKSGAKVRRIFDISKEAGGAGQNLICNPLSVSGLVLPSLSVSLSRRSAGYVIRLAEY
jgi:hypothetical protein